MRVHNEAFLKALQQVNAREHVPLAPFCTLKVGGKARYFVTPQSIEEIISVQRACLDYGVALHILSGGSNTLFSDLGFNGVVLKLGAAFDHITPNDDGMHVKAAVYFAKVTKRAIALGWGQAVGWSGTPGLVGGAVRMNAGTRLGEIKDAIKRVYGVHQGQERVFEHSEIEFGYRFNNLPHDLIITGVDLGYEKSRLENSDVLEARVQEYRLKRKKTQPNIPSAGSFFKNPYPSFAAQLIENCNIKGLQYGGAQISSLHANFIVNRGGATADEILYIASLAKKAVFERFGIMLVPEIRMVGEFNKLA